MCDFHSNCLCHIPYSISKATPLLSSYRVEAVAKVGRDSQSICRLAVNVCQQLQLQITAACLHGHDRDEGSRAALCGKCSAESSKDIC